MIYHPVPKTICIAGDRKATKAACIKLAKKIARMGGVCRKCGRTKKQGWRIHAAHVLPVTYPNTAAMTMNILPLCASCHSVGRTSAHQNPHEFVLWFEKEFPGKYQLLQAIANTYRKNDWSMIYIGLQAEEKRNL